MATRSIPLTVNQLTTLVALMADTISEAKTWDWMRSIRQTETLQLMNTNLGSLAIVATFLAAVQAQVISSSLDRNMTNLETASNALFFAGLFVDVLGGTIAIVGSVQIQRAYGLVKQRESSLAGLKDALNSSSRSAEEQDTVALVHHLHYLERVIFPLLHSPGLWSSLSTPLKQSADLVEQIIKDSDVDDHVRITIAYSLSDYRHTTNRLAASSFFTSLGFAASLTVPSLVVAGLVCFTAGASCFVLDTQPVSVWATSFGVLGGTMLLLITVIGFITGIDPRPVSRPFNNV